MSDEFTDESGLETSVLDLQFILDDKVNVELFQMLIQILPANSELNPEMFSPDELRSCAGKQDVISDHMYSLHLAYLIWKQSRKANERIPEVIQLSVKNIRPKSRENRKIYKNFIQKRLSEYQLKEISQGYLLRKGEKIVLSQGMLKIVIEWHHVKLNHPKVSALIKSIKLHFHFWGVNNENIKKIYAELSCDICLSDVSLPKRGHHKHIKNYGVFERIQIDLTQIAFEKEDILARKGFLWVLNVIDCFSKFAWVYPLKTKETKPICEILCKLFYKEGIPLIMQSDNGGEFVSNIIKDVMPKIDIKLINGSPYTPTTQGQVERFNQTFKSLFKKKIQLNCQ